MVTHMKTTIEIADDLLARAKREARRRRTTLRDVVDEALRQRLATDTAHSFRLRKHPFQGRGLQPSVAEGQWDTVRDLIWCDAFDISIHVPLVVSLSNHEQSPARPSTSSGRAVY